MSIQKTTKKILKEKEEKDPLTFLKANEIIEARVINKGRKTIYFDLGPYGIGVCYKSEFFDLPQDMKEIEEGKLVSVKVLNSENDEGYVELSLRRAGEEKSWDYIRDKMKKGEDITVRIIGANRGGLLTKVRDVDAFLPASQQRALVPAARPVRALPLWHRGCRRQCRGL